jgi:hypothetical protein
MGALAGHNRNRVVRYHCLHIGDLVNGSLAPNQPERKSEDSDTTNENADIGFPVGVHTQHETHHDNGHCRPHHKRHICSSFAEENVIQLVRVQMHKSEHNNR